MLSKLGQQYRSRFGGNNPSNQQHGHGFGTAPVFLASISTILGAILFLRFGYAVGNVGFLKTLAIIVLGHLVTIPTVLAVSEIATNRRVAGGGAYYIVSRSFGTSIGGTIGCALYLSQAISIAFYMVAFAEAFEPVLSWIADYISSYYQDIDNPNPSDPININARWLSIPCTIILIVIMLSKGANIGVSMLWGICAILAVSLIAFFMGGPPETIDTLPEVIGKTPEVMETPPEVIDRTPEVIDKTPEVVDKATEETRLIGSSITASVPNGDPFGKVFAICFPAFTGMIAGLGLSGDLRNPQRSIPLGTITATLAGMVVYVLVAIKLWQSATPADLADPNKIIMADISAWRPAIFIGLGAASFSSALGSIMVAPRTLQALARDNVLPIPGLNRLMRTGVGKSQEPVPATFVSGAIAVVFVAIGELNFIAQILTMFFLVTYGALCVVSFLEHFAGNPSYRPTFHSRWYVSLLGTVMCGLMMFQINVFYAFLSIFLILAIYIGLRRGHREQRGMIGIFQGAMFQLTRWLQTTLQKNRANFSESGWRPSIVGITQFGERRLGHFDLLRWLCHRQGFGQFIQFFPGDYSFPEEISARIHVDALIQQSEASRAGIFVDSLICPTFQLALAQVLQMPGISGLPNNTILLEFDHNHPEEIPEVQQGASLAVESLFNVLILRSTKHRFGYRSSIHVWVTDDNLANVPMMLLLAYILVGHSEWKRAKIRLFACSTSWDTELDADELSTVIKEGRLPISMQNVTSVSYESEEALEQEVTHRSAQADLVITGLTIEDINSGDLDRVLQRYQGVNDVLFVHSIEPISID
ncbi:amino acid permease [Candidatus Poribacteria bacterium]|nr:amino acid permease [Candidatus Poribacteria bacterium]